MTGTGLGSQQSTAYGLRLVCCLILCRCEANNGFYIFKGLKKKEYVREEIVYNLALSRKMFADSCPRNITHKSKQAKQYKKLGKHYGETRA